MEKHSRKIKLDNIETKVTEFINSRKNTNNLVDILAYLESDDVKVVLAAVRAVHRVCTHVINTGLLTTRSLSQQTPQVMTDSDKEKVYLSWLNDRYSDSCQQLCDLLSHNNSSIQDLSLCTLMKFVQTEGRVAIAAQLNQTFPFTLMQQVIKALLHSSQDLSILIGKFQEYMEFDDVRYFTMKTIQPLVKSHSEESFLNLTNTFALLTNLSLKETADDDQLNNFYAVDADGSCAKTKLSSLKQHKVMFQGLWLDFLKLKLSPSLYHRVLVVIDDKVMPFMVNPLQLSDFLTNSYNIGGATSLLALNGLFRLIHGYNLDYPDFYGKLYALLEPSLFHVKYRARFFYLLDLFLTSTHLPAYLIAAFIKRLCRLGLTAPPYALTVLIPFVFNLLQRHDACKVLIHRPAAPEMDGDPFDETETNPAKCQALDSSLWELKSLVQHYHHSIANEAKKMEQPLPKQEVDLASLLDTSINDLMAVERKKKVKMVPKAFDVPTGLFTGTGTSCMSQLWHWGPD